MPAGRVSMRKTKELLRLKFEHGLTNRQIARSCQVSRSTVAEYLSRAARAGLTWPLPEELDEGRLENLLFCSPAQPAVRVNHAPCSRPQPDLIHLHKELRNPHVTLQLLWQEYKQEHPDGYQYSQFCDRYRRWARKLDVTMRQEHKAGDKLFVDYAGPTVPVVDRDSGVVREAYLFVAVLGASNYTYVEASLSQDSPAWIAAHGRAFSFFGGVPACLVPDNLKSGVKRPCRYEPDLNPIYQEMAQHYGTVVMPARVRRPRDKSKVENAVLVVERWILAVLRHRTFFSLAELNEAIRQLLDRLNHRKFRKLDTTRARLFEELDRPALRPLPLEPFCWTEVKRARVNIDYHIEIDGHYYSVPYQLVHEEVEARISASTIEVLYKGRRLVTHVRSFVRGGYTTLAEHRPKHHQKYLEWNPERFRRWAETIGPDTAAAVTRILASRTYPEQAYRSCLGILRLGDRFSKSRLESACTRALRFQALSYKSIKSILETGLDRESVDGTRPAEVHPLVHANVRGAAYYRGGEEADAASAND
ncbi:MAG: IS21 family transposase [Acidobacteria bacterium]|nr:IS21 family transposase [Acidobacteriota bacterium]